MSESQARLAAIRAKQAAGIAIDLNEVIEVQAVRLREVKSELREAVARAERADAELHALTGRLAVEATLRPSLEVLQRMANGIDQFDRGRFQCAVAALQHGTPRLSASLSQVHTTYNVGDRLEAARARREASRGLKVIDGDGAGAA
jgi:hypothetical protein